MIFGINAVTEALKARGRSFDYIAVSPERHDLRVHKIVTSCRELGVPVRQLPREQLNRLAPGSAHQGVIAVASAKQYADVDEVLANQRGEWPFVLLLDGVEDPHNLGAIIRTADGAGADGVIIPERRAVGVTGTVDESFSGSQRASADCARHQCGSHARRVEGKEYLDGRPR